MLSLRLFFLLIEAFTTVPFSLSFKHRPQLPNDLFIQHRAWKSVLTVILPDGPPPPHMGGPGAELHQGAAERRGTARRRPHVVSFQWQLFALPADQRARKGVVTSTERQLAFQISAGLSRISSPHIQSSKCYWRWLWLKQITGACKIHFFLF